MQSKKIFTIYDSKVEAYAMPWYAHTEGEAIRSFQEAVNDQNSAYAKYPEDFTLFLIGEFSENDAKLTAYDAKKSIINAMELTKKEN